MVVDISPTRPDRQNPNVLMTSAVPCPLSMAISCGGLASLCSCVDRREGPVVGTEQCCLNGTENGNSGIPRVLSKCKLGSSGYSAMTEIWIGESTGTHASKKGVTAAHLTFLVLQDHLYGNGSMELTCLPLCVTNAITFRLFHICSVKASKSVSRAFRKYGLLCSYP